MEATLEKIIKDEFKNTTSDNLLAEIEVLSKKDNVSSGEIELTLNSRFNLDMARTIHKYKQWKKI